MAHPMPDYATAQSIRVIFSLMAYREHSNCVVIFDVEHSHTATPTRRNKAFTEKGVGAIDLLARQ